MKHLFLYISTIMLITSSLTPFAAHAALTRAEQVARVGKSLFMPWKATRAFENTVSNCTTGIAVAANVCDWMQPLQPHGDKKEKEAYRKALKDPSMRHWVSLYNVIWCIKKGVACNEIYRLSSRFHWQAHNPLEYAISILKIITIFGDRIIEPEQLEKTSQMIVQRTSKTGLNTHHNTI